MAYINIDVDLDDFDFKEVLEHVEGVYQNGYHTKLLNEWAYSVFGIEEEPNLSVSDTIKMQFIKDNFDKLTLDKLQSLL